MEIIINSLLQALALSLLAERITDTILRAIRAPKSQQELSLDWGKLGISISTLVGLLICYVYGFDLIKIVTGGSENKYVGIVLSALVIGGGARVYDQ